MTDVASHGSVWSRACPSKNRNSRHGRTIGTREEQPKQFPELGTPRTHREFSARENPRVLALPNVLTIFVNHSCSNLQHRSLPWNSTIGRLRLLMHSHLIRVSGGVLSFFIGEFVKSTLENLRSHRIPLKTDRFLCRHCRDCRHCYLPKLSIRHLLNNRNLSIVRVSSAPVADNGSKPERPSTRHFTGFSTGALLSLKKKPGIWLAWFCLRSG